MKRVQRYIDAEKEISWRQVALLLVEKGLLPQAQFIFTSHGAATRFPRIDLLSSILHLSVLLDQRDTIGAYLQRLDTSTIPRSEIARFDFYRAFNIINDIESSIDEWEKGMRTIQRKSEVEHQINELSNYVKVIMQSTFTEYEQQVDDMLRRYVNVMKRYNRLTGNRFDQIGMVKQILEHRPHSDFGLQFMIVS
jgi:hypothetical protein